MGDNVMRELNRNATVGYRELMGLVRMGDEPWSDTMGMLFAAATVAFVRTGEIMPDFRPSPVLDVSSDSALDDSWPDSQVVDLYDAGTVTLGDLRAVYTVMSRHADLLRLAGRNY